MHSRFPPDIREAQADAWDDCADTAGDAMGIGGVPHAIELHGYNPYRTEQNHD